MVLGFTELKKSCFFLIKDGWLAAGSDAIWSMGDYEPDPLELRSLPSYHPFPWFFLESNCW